MVLTTRREMKLPRQAAGTARRCQASALRKKCLSGEGRRAKREGRSGKRRAREGLRSSVSGLWSPVSGQAAGTGKRLSTAANGMRFRRNCSSNCRGRLRFHRKCLSFCRGISKFLGKSSVFSEESQRFTGKAQAPWGPVQSFDVELQAWQGRRFHGMWWRVLAEAVDLRRFRSCASRP
jgi:hypothetical protein